MPSNDKKKPAKATVASRKPAGPVAGGANSAMMNAGQTKPSDAGRLSAATGGKGASSKKGR